MSDNLNSDQDRWEELKVAASLFALTPEEQTEFDALSSKVPDQEAHSLELVIAALDIAWADAETMPLPDSLRQTVLQQSKAESLSQGNQPSITTLKREQSEGNLRNYLPWFVAAACLALAAFIWFAQRPGQQVQPSVAQLRAALLRSSADLVQADWSAGPTPIPGATGDVVWDAKSQQGYMRFSGLPINAPTKEQYQLWIFDKNQSDKTPIDGGVFNITSTGEVVVPIDAKLRVQDAFMFAVTIEKPGGVVVSSRERLPLLAQVD